jgi:hypothetical protein
MSDPPFRLPFRSREQPLGPEALDLADALDDPEGRRVVQHILFEAGTERDLRTVGDLLDRFEGMEPAERRAVVDEARTACGLTTFTELERRREFAKATRWPPPPVPTGPRRAEDGSVIQQCAAEACERLSGDAGFPAPSRARRFWCAEHAHLASPGDLEDFVEHLRVDPATGLPRMSEAAEAHYRELDEKERAKSRREREAREAEAERIEKLRREWEESAAAAAPPLLGIFPQRVGRHDD